LGFLPLFLSLFFFQTNLTTEAQSYTAVSKFLYPTDLMETYSSYLKSPIYRCLPRSSQSKSQDGIADHIKMLMVLNAASVQRLFTKHRGMKKTRHITSVLGTSLESL
jgi:hypothetical protein